MSVHVVVTPGETQHAPNGHGLGVQTVPMRSMAFGPQAAVVMVQLFAASQQAWSCGQGFGAQVGLPNAPVKPGPQGPAASAHAPVAESQQTATQGLGWQVVYWPPWHSKWRTTAQTPVEASQQATGQAKLMHAPATKVPAQVAAERTWQLPIASQQAPVHGFGEHVVPAVATVPGGQVGAASEHTEVVVSQQSAAHGFGVHVV